MNTPPKNPGDTLASPLVADPVSEGATVPTATDLLGALGALAAGLETLAAAFRPHARTRPAGARRTHGKMSAARLRGMPLLTFLVRANPALGTAETADAIDAGVQASVLSRNAINKVTQLLALLQEVERLEEGDA